MKGYFWGVLLGMAGAPALADDYLTFQSPSGNIFCMMAGAEFAEVRCDMVELTPSYTRRPADCELDWGSSFYVSAEGRGGLTCAGDTVMDPGAPVLGYGGSLSLGGFTCSSAETGITCENADGHGFSISKAKQRVY